MEIKTFAELIEPDKRTLQLSIMGTLNSEEAAKHQQQAIADCDLAPEVTEGTRKSFERLCTVYSYGILCYEMFTVADSLAWLLLEQALRERFIAFYNGIIPLVDKKGDKHPLRASNFNVVAEAFRRGDYRKEEWCLQLLSGDTMKFRPNLAQLQDWARRERLLDGQHNKRLDPVSRRLRNFVAHPSYHLLMPNDSALTIRDLAEIINRLWGHYTRGGRLYPAPLEREILILAWSEEVKKGQRYILRDYQLDSLDEPGDWQCVIIRAVYDRMLYEFEFDTQYERTPFPTDYLWGPGTREDALAWIAQTNPQGDTVPYLDRLFAVRIHNSKVSLARRPEVVIALPKDKQLGQWFLILADYPNDAFAHVRHIKDGIDRDGCSCAVEQLFDGNWTEMVEYLADNHHITEPAALPSAIWVSHMVLDVAPDVEAD